MKIRYPAVSATAQKSEWTINPQYHPVGSYLSWVVEWRIIEQVTLSTLSLYWSL